MLRGGWIGEAAKEKTEENLGRDWIAERRENLAEKRSRFACTRTTPAGHQVSTIPFQREPTPLGIVSASLIAKRRRKEKKRKKRRKKNKLAESQKRTGIQEGKQGFERVYSRRCIFFTGLSGALVACLRWRWVVSKGELFFNVWANLLNGWKNRGWGRGRRTTSETGD